VSLEGPAAPATKISREPLTTRANPPDPPTWIADHETVRRHILGHDRTGTNESVPPNGQAADHHNAGAQSGPALHYGRQELRTMTLDMCPRTQVISEDDSWTKEYIVVDLHALEDHDLVFDRDAVTDRCAVLNEGSVADVAVTADAGAGKDMGKRPDSRPLPNLIALAQSVRMHENTIHWQRSPHRTTHQFQWS
jgi:hypothetical protein